MGSFLFLAVISTTIFPAWLQAPSGNKAQKPFSIEIRPASASVEEGAPMMLKIRLTNTTEHLINLSDCWDQGADLSYDYNVRDVNGGTPHRKNSSGPLSETCKMRALGPHETAEQTTDIGALFDLDAGEYSIQLSRKVSSAPSDGTVSSNEVALTVVGSKVCLGARPMYASRQQQRFCEDNADFAAGPPIGPMNIATSTIGPSRSWSASRLH